ncbi:MAG: ABC transporter permease [Actinobacteria bacterium]|nr:ABC transporter permease [Actinomycetota bacterium]
MSTVEAATPELDAELVPRRPDIPADPSATWPSLRRIGVRGALSQYLKDLWRWRNFMITVPLNDMRAQNQDTFFGQLWHLLNPLMLALIYYVIFGVILGISRGGVENYPAFLIVGVITFNYTRTSLRSGARIIVRNRKLVQSVNFPRAALPISALLENIVSHVIAIGIMWLVLIATGISPSPAWLLVVPILIIQSLFNLGLAMFVARFAFHFRDTQQFLPYVLRIWFYVSGVLIPIEARFVTMPSARAVLQANPIYVIIDVSRDAFMYGVVDTQQLFVAAAWAVGLFVGGFLYFRRAEHEYGLV